MTNDGLVIALQTIMQSLLFILNRSQQFDGVNEQGLLLSHGSCIFCSIQYACLLEESIRRASMKNIAPNRGNEYYSNIYSSTPRYQLFLQQG